MIRLAAFALAAILLAAAPARAEWQLAPFFGFTFKGETSLVDVEDGAPKVHWTFGATGTLIGRGPIGIEGLFIYTPGFFESDEVSALAGSKTYAVMGNVVLAAPLRWNEYGLRPLISGGLGLMHASQQPQIVDVFPIDRNFFGYNVGGGAIGFLTDRTGLRFDLRYYSSLSRTQDTGLAFGTARLHYWTGTVGVVIKY